MIKQLAESPQRELPRIPFPDTFWINKTRETDLEIIWAQMNPHQLQKAKRKWKIGVDRQISNMVYGYIAWCIWACNRHSMGVTVYTFPTHNQERKRAREMHGERKTSIKADSVHNLKRGSSSEEMLCCCCCCSCVGCLFWESGRCRCQDELDGLAWLGTRKRTSGEHSAWKQEKKKKLTVAY